MKLPTALLTALLSTAAIAGQYDNIYIAPACYVNGEPTWFDEQCPKTPIEPAYMPSLERLNYIKPMPTIDYGSRTAPEPMISYDTPSRPSSPGLYLIHEVGHGNVNIVGSDGSVMFCGANSCFQP